MNYIFSFFRKYKETFLGFFFLILIINIIVIFSVITSQTNYINKQLNANIFEYNEVDYDYLCNISLCKEIYLKDKTFIKSDILVSTKFEKPNFTKIGENIYFNFNDFDILLYNKASEAYFAIGYTNTIFNTLLNLSLLFPAFLIILFVSLFRIYKREITESLVRNIGNEAILANKSMIMITENVHHELNTPIDVIENKICKIEDTITKYILKQQENQVINDRRTPTPEQIKINKKFVKMHRDFEFIHTSIEQILGVLSKMKNFKSLRYSNGDKNIYDIVYGAFKIINISNTDFIYEVDEEFKNYQTIKNGLKNVDILNILINHLKNSLEANSTEIKCFVESIIVKNNKNLLTIGIKDNGSGIPKEIQKNVFKANLSTKAIGDSIRGNGMYLNKHIVEEFGGYISVKETSAEGTTILLSIPVILVERDIRGNKL